MVTVADEPLLKVDGSIAIDASAGGGIVTVTDAVRVVPLYVAMTVTVVEPPTLEVST